MGPDSFAGRLSCVIQGSTETTFYVLAVYFGSVGVKKTRHALACALAAEVDRRDRGDRGDVPVLRLRSRAFKTLNTAVNPSKGGVMMRLYRPYTVAALMLGVLFAATSALAQGAADTTGGPLSPIDSTRAMASLFDSTGTYGSYIPNAGFKVSNTAQGDLNIRIFTFVRYLNQNGLDATYTDSFGNTSTIQRRQDIMFQKVLIFFQGWVIDPRFKYLTYVWTANTSMGQGAQVVVAGSLNYVFRKEFMLGAGVDGLPGVRTTEGNFPYWLTVDNRQIADEFFRPSYTMGVWARGTVLDRLTYRAMLGNNLSQLGINPSQLDNQLNTTSAALIWLPTTGEFGTNGGFGDFDVHKNVATRLAAHYTSSTENRQAAPTSDAFANVQIRLSDGNPIFAPNLFGPGVQLDDADYHMFAADGGVKYHGLSLDGEFYWRRVDALRGSGVETLTFDKLEDNGFQMLASGMLMPKTLQAYAGVSKIYGQYGDPWDMRFGINWFPWNNYVGRWNTEVLHINRSPVGGSSLPTVVGGTGDVFYTSLQLNF